MDFYPKNCNMSDQHTSDTNPERAQPAPVIESPTNACDLTLFSEANKFAEEMIKKIPELHGLAIVPIWMPQLQDIPRGLLRLRNETPPYIAALLQMLGNISAFGMDVQRDMMAQLRAFDQMAKDISTEVQNKVAELKSVNEQIVSAKEGQK